MGDLRLYRSLYHISIHAPREGRDLMLRRPRVKGRHFNPRAPRGARRTETVHKSGYTSISIHAPREGRDA